MDTQEEALDDAPAIQQLRHQAHRIHRRALLAALTLTAVSLGLTFL